MSKKIEAETRDSLDTDQKLLFALLRAIEIIGEAASRLTQECQNEHPQIPWHAIIGMRNRLIHAYFDINRDLVWDTIRNNLPTLINALEKIIPANP